MPDISDPTWTYYPSNCRAPACRCESPCDDMGGTFECTRCSKAYDDCECERCDGCCGFIDECECEPEEQPVEYDWHDAYEDRPGAQQVRTVGRISITKFADNPIMRQVAGHWHPCGISLYFHVEGDDAADRLAGVLNSCGEATLRKMLADAGIGAAK